jgi:RNA polymerase sigma factor (sigma-70 family)
MARADGVGVVRWIRDAAGTDAGGEPDAELVRRFAVSGDAVAFRTLVARHGPVVWGVCRRLARNHHDAEDAFQATFLVLARAAGGVRDGGAVGGWLCGVAARVTARLRASQRLEPAPVEPTDGHPDGPLGELTVREAEAVLFEELAHLPERHRAPIVLCCLEGLSRDEAATRLGWSANRVKHGLERGRKSLRARLERRGITLGLPLLTTALAVTPAAAMPQSAAGSAVRFAAGVAPPAAIASLARGVHRAMWISHWKWTAIAAAALFVGAGGMLAGLSRPAVVPLAPPLPALQIAPVSGEAPAAQKPVPMQPWEIASDYLQAIVDGKPEWALRLADSKKIAVRHLKAIETSGLKRVRPVLVLLNDYQALVVFERAKLKRASNAQPDDLHAVVQLQRKDGPKPWLVAEHDITGESSIWREADDYLMGKFNFDRVPNKIQPEPLKDAKKPTWSVAEEFLRQALSGKTADALKLTVPGTVSENKTIELKDLFFTSASPVAVLLNDNRIEVVFQQIVTAKMETGHVVLMLARSKDGRWQVKDIDFRDQERLEPRVKLYLSGEYDQKPAAK